MRIIVMSDMEGVSGIVKWEQVEGGESLYEEGRKLYTEEINAVVRGARAGGATEIVVMDCHGAGKGWTFNSLLPEVLDPRCEWVVQHEWTHYTEFLEHGCDGALFVGMHARAGTATGVLNHTVSGSDWHNLWFNETLVGETGINAALCGTLGLPRADGQRGRRDCARGVKLLGEGIVTVAVKQGLGRFSARHLPPPGPGADRGRSTAGGRDHGSVGALRPRAPVRDRRRVHGSDLVEPYRNREGVEMLEPRKLVSGRRLVDGLAAVLAAARRLVVEQPELEHVARIEAVDPERLPAASTAAPAGMRPTSSLPATSTPRDSASALIVATISCRAAASQSVTFMLTCTSPAVGSSRPSARTPGKPPSRSRTIAAISRAVSTSPSAGSR